MKKTTSLTLAFSGLILLVKKYGTPSYGSSAAYPIATIARYMGWDPKSALKRLHKKDIVVTSPRQP